MSVNSIKKRFSNIHYARGRWVVGGCRGGWLISAWKYAVVFASILFSRQKEAACSYACWHNNNNHVTRKGTCMLPCTWENTHT